MTTTGNNTLDRIQKEIKETLQREDELRNKYGNIFSNNSKITNNNGIAVKPNENEKPLTSENTNGFDNSNSNQKLNGFTGFRRFTPNSTTKGVMQKFLKMRGRVNLPTIKNKQQANNNWVYDDVFEPAKVTVEKGKPARNGFVSAEEKMKKELQEFQLREAELRKERRKSQPDIMATLDEELQNGHEFEETISNLKAAKSMANIYNNEDLDFLENNHSAPCSLKPARSLAALCDVSDEELELPGTYSLIMQFEKMKSQQVRS